MTSVSKKILIVDDEENLTWSIEKNLKNEYKEHEIFSATSGDEALRMLKLFSVDLVISDILMPGTSGLELLEYVKNNHPQTQVIIMTSLNNAEIKGLADDKAGVYYFEKPFEMSEFKKTIQYALKKISNEYNRQLSSLTLKEIIEYNYKNKFTGFVNIQNGKKSGAVYFRGGEIIHAKASNLDGEMALINVLNWDKVNYDIVCSNDPVKRTIYYGWKLLLKDELANH